MIQLEKLPRWFLITLCTAAIGISWLFGSYFTKNAIAEVRAAKKDAAEALGASKENSKEIVEMRSAINKISRSQEVARREYREDQINLNSKLDRILTKI